MGQGRGGRGGKRKIKMRRRGGGVERWVKLGTGASDPCSSGLQCMRSLWSLASVSERPETGRSTWLRPVGRPGQDR